MSNKRIIVTALILFFVMINLILVRSDSPKIDIKLDYKDDASYDTNQDGIEPDNKIIDFTVEDTVFNWDVDKSHLCTRWEIISMDHSDTTAICYGSDKCCRFIGLNSEKESWDNTFYLNYLRYGTSQNTQVKARVIFVDYNLYEDNPYSKIHYSDYDYLYAVFLDRNYFNGETSDNYELIEKLENIKNRNQLVRVSLTDDKDNPVLDDLNGKNLNLNLVLGPEEASDTSIVAIRDFKDEDTDWKRLEEISINKESQEIKDYVESTGLSLKKSITVNGVDQALGPQNYKGYIKFNTKGISYNKVLHCSDTLECSRLKECDTPLEQCFIRSKENIEVYIPHFSSIILALNSSDINLTVKSPENNSILSNGENTHLNFSTNLTISADYSLDNQAPIELGSSTSFSSTLQGYLDNGILSNGIHSLSINLRDDESSIAQYNLSFEIDDILPPQITFTFNSSNPNNSVVSSPTKINEFIILSDECAKISYKLNDGQYSDFIDLGVDRNGSIDLDLQDGTNHLLINVTDMHGNSQLNYFTFTFDSPSCSDGIQNQDETGIDCGGSCTSCIQFDVTVDKTTYESGEDILVTILSRADSIVNLTVFSGSTATYNEIITGYSPDYPIYLTTVIDSISSPGSYVINATSEYMGTKEHKVINIHITPVINILEVSIEANASEINEGGTIRFTASVGGYEGPLTYKWDFNNDGSIDSYSTEVTKTYNSNGTYVVNLTVNDNSNTDSDKKTITVKKVINITILVKNDSGNVLNDSSVKFRNVWKDTSTDGKTSFLVNPGSHELEIKKDGYLIYSNNSVEVSESKTIEVRLEVDVNDYSSPSVSILDPDDNKVFTKDSVKIVYKVEDDYKVNCSLHLNEYQSWWIEKENRTNAPRDSENSFTLSGLVNGSYRYRIKCINSRGGSDFSDTRTLYINSQDEEEATEINEDTDIIISKINDAITGFKGLNKEESEVYEALKIEENLNKAKTQIQRYNRDLNNLIWRRLNATELKEAEIEIYENIENLKNEIPVKLEVIGSKEFVSYPSKEDINNVISMYINSTHKKFSKKQIRYLIEEVEKLQSLIVITTKTKTVHLEYLSNKDEKITLIEKGLKIEGSKEKLKLIEYIPRKFAQDIDDIGFMFEYEKIEGYPLIEIDLEETSKLVYYLRNDVGLENLKEIPSILVNKEDLLTSKGPSGITGFAVIDDLKSKFISSSNKRIVIEIIIIIVLILIYFGYSVNGAKIKYYVHYITDRKSIKNLNTIKTSITNAKNELQKNNYEKARSFYVDMQGMFKDLPKGMKKEVYGNITILSNKLDAMHINQLLDQATKSIGKKDRANAVMLYGKITKIYKQIAPDYKSQVLKRCNELRLKLGEGNAS